MSHPQSKRAKAAKRRRATERRQRAAEGHSGRAERRAASEERRDRGRARKTRRTRIRTSAAAVIIVTMLGGLAYLVFNDVRPGPEVDAVERPSYRGRGHVIGASFASSTPTSGAHDSRVPTCRVYANPLEPALAVHALEHGVVVLWYDASRPELALDLANIANEWTSHVIVSPSTDLSEPVVATAWRRQKSYTEIVPELSEFVATYRNRGPEKVTCDQA